MATIGTEYNLRDVVASQDPSGHLLPVVDTLYQEHEFIPLLPWIASNQPMSHSTAYVTSRPTPQWTKFNKGVTFGKATTKAVTDNVAMMGLMARVDKRFLTTGVTDKAKWRFSQEKPFRDAMRDEFAQTFFYGDETTALEEFTGLAPRFDALPPSSLDQTLSSYNVISGAGTGSDNTSLWVMRLAENGVHGLYPENGIAGLSMEDMGERLLGDDTNGYINYLVTAYAWQCGIHVADWRSCVRICNIDWSNLNAGTGADLFDLLMQAIERLPTHDNAVIVGHRLVLAKLGIAQRLQQEQFQIKGTEGYTMLSTFAGIPLLRSDAITLAEGTIS